MRAKLLVIVTIMVAAAAIAWSISSALGKAKSSYSSFSRSYWEEVYPFTFDIFPTGDIVVFTAHGNGGRDLYALYLRTKRVLRLTNSPQFEAEVRFLDNNTVIVSAVEDPKSMSSPQYLYLVNVDGGTRLRLTADPRMRDSTIVPLASGQFLFSRAEIKKQFNPIWGFVVKPWGFVDVYSVLVGDYLMNTQTGRVERVHYTSTWIYLDEVGAVFADRRRVIQLISRGMTEDMFLTYLSAQLGSAEIRAVRKKRLARNAKCPVLSDDERFVYYVTQEPSNTKYNIMRLDLLSFRPVRLIQSSQGITCLRRSGHWLFFLEGSGKEVTLWRMDTQGKRLENLLSPAQFANPLGQ